MVEPVHFVAPAVMHVRASVASDVEPHVEWSVGYAPEVDERGERFVITRLSAAEDEASVEVDLAATQLGGDFGDLDDEEAEAQRFEEALDEASGLDLLWDMVRMVARSAVAHLDTDIDIPVVSPSPDFSRLIRQPPESADAARAADG